MTLDLMLELEAAYEIAMTFIFEPDAYVRFGVLHLLAFASLFAFPLVRRPVIAFIFGLFFLFVLHIQGLQVQFHKNLAIQLHLHIQPPLFETEA